MFYFLIEFVFLFQKYIYFPFVTNSIECPFWGLNGATKKDTSSNYETDPRVCTTYNLHFSLILASRAMLLNPADEADGAAQLNGFCRINTLATSFVFDIYPWITIINGKQLVTGFGIYAEISVIFRYTNI